MFPFARSSDTLKASGRLRSERRCRADETITRFGDRLIALAERVLAENGGAIRLTATRPVWRIPAQKPANVEPLSDAADQLKRLRSELPGRIEADLASADGAARARGAYLAICLGLDDDLRRKDAARWDRSLAELKGRAGKGKLDLTFRRSASSQRHSGG
jgi:hypothetical protein